MRIVLGIKKKPNQRYQKIKNKLFVKKNVKTLNLKTICAHTEFVICIQDKHLMIIYLYYFITQSMIRIYKFLDTWSKCCHKYGQLGILWKNSKHQKAKTTYSFFYEFNNSHLYLSKGTVLWHFIISTKALRFLKSNLLKILSKIKSIRGSRYSNFYLGIIFVQIFSLIHSPLNILVTNFQARMFFMLYEPTSKAIYKNFLSVFITGKLFEIFFDHLWKILQLFEYRVSKFYSISKKTSLLINLLILALILLVTSVILTHSYIIPDLVYLKWIWNIPTYRILMITSIFFFENSFVQCFLQCWFFSNTAHIFNCFQYTPELSECPMIYQCLKILNISTFIIFFFICEFTKDSTFSSEVLWVDNKRIHEQWRNSQSNSNTLKEYINLQFQ